MTFFKVIACLDNNNRLYVMKNISRKKLWGEDTNLAHVEPLLIPLVKENSTGK